MSEYTEQEAALEKRKCKKCSGIGTIMVGFEDEPCPSCNETGFAVDPFTAFLQKYRVDISDLERMLGESIEPYALEALELLIGNTFTAGQEAGE